MREVLTARDSSIGSSGGTTDVRISVHSRNNLYRFRSGSSVPEHGNQTTKTVGGFMCYVLTFDPDVGCSCDGKDEEEENENKGL